MLILRIAFCPAPFVSGLLEDRIVAFERTTGALPLDDAVIVGAVDDAIGVKLALTTLVDDLTQITGRQFPLFTSDGRNASALVGNRTAIIAASVDSSLIKDLVQRNRTIVKTLDHKWEKWSTSLVQNHLPGVERALLIVGSDKRGTIFGIHSLAEQCGQSPFHYWLDVPVTKHDAIYALPVTTTQGEPSVKFRGFFINDEAPGLTGWWSAKHGVDHYPLDSEFYRHVFDLLLRLKANFLWPAMWKSSVPRPGNIFFTDDSANQQLADDYGIVVSTSHHEPMQRASNEWDPDKTGTWDWSKNKANVTRFMDEGVSRAVGKETYFTLGMRGPGDSAISGDDPISILEDVFATEREILGNHYSDVTKVNQVWTIYKEVATYYSQGLLPPDDVTLMFSDDNFGNIQRLPTEDELKRSGGYGLYYHMEYVGRPKSYKWQNVNNLAKVLKELTHAHERGVDRIWVMNVGDIKPMELPFSLAMDLAWNRSSITFDSLPTYLRAFASRELGDHNADEVAEILAEHSRLLARRKYEHITPGTYSTLNFRENERVLKEWTTLADRVADLGNRITADLKPNFFHLLQYPIVAGFMYHAVVLGQGKNLQFAYERRNSANSKAMQVLNHFEADFDLIEEYDQLLDGKWAGILSQPKYDMTVTDWRGPSRDILGNLSYVQLRQNFDYGYGNLGNFAEGSLSTFRQGRVCVACGGEGTFSPTLPVMNRYGPEKRIVEIFHRCDYRVPISWKLEIERDWLHIEPSSGTVSRDVPQQELEVSIDWNTIPADFNSTVNVPINYDTLPKFDLIRIPIDSRLVPDDFVGFPESAGIISIEAARYQRAFSSNATVSFQNIPYLSSRSESGSIALRPYSIARTLSDTSSAWVEHDIYLFDKANVTATIYVNAGLDTDPGLLMEYSLTLDSRQTNFTRLLSDPATAGGLPDEWTGAVGDNVWTKNDSFGEAEAGKHTLRWSVNSPEVYLEKIVLGTRGQVPESYLGPLETKSVGL